MSRLPQGWAGCTFGEVTKIVAGGTPPSKDETNFTEAGGVPWLTPADLSGYRSMYIKKGARNLSEKGFATCSATLMPAGSVLFSSRAPIGYIAIAENEISTNQGFKSFVLPAEIESRYTYYYLKLIKPLAEQMATGTTFKELSGSATAKLPLLIAPLPEQKRIADKLDSVLARVDACRDRLDRLPALLKRFRQSILAAATSGRLTNDFRATPNEELLSFKVAEPYTHTVSAPDTWTQYRLGDICDFVGGSQPPKSTFTSVEGADAVRLIQIRDYKSDKYMTFIPRNLARRFCNKTDVMIGRYGPPIFQILRGLEGAYNVALMKAEPKINAINLEYLYYFLKGDTLLKYVEAGSDRTAGQDGVRKELLYPYPTFLPSLSEQSEIVRRIELLFDFADRLEARLSTARKQVSQLTPALLAKAFRGELVPQDPADEPATELLKRLAASNKPKEKSKRQKRTAVSIK